ncbi:hypothetical protein Bbelb_300570 [Branchiostoma belcheri]|nr:hypothetical protein Bbelb_300570 [Branchiostoma belcheri]
MQSPLGWRAIIQVCPIPTVCDHRCVAIDNARYIRPPGDKKDLIEPNNDIAGPGRGIKYRVLMTPMCRDQTYCSCEPVYDGRRLLAPAGTALMRKDLADSWRQRRRETTSLNVRTAGLINLSCNQIAECNSVGQAE